MRKIKQSQVASMTKKGAQVKPKAAPAPKPDRSEKLEQELKMVKAKLTEMSKSEKKKRFEFTVERDNSGFIQKIHAKEL